MTKNKEIKKNKMAIGEDIMRRRRMFEMRTDGMPFTVGGGVIGWY